MVSSPVLARHGMVASPHYLASVAGLRVLQEGGTAVDAAITTNAVLGVVYPHMTGIGGDAFWLIYDAGGGALHGLNGSGRAGALATPEHFLAGGHAVIPARGPLSAVTVPGAVDSWCVAHGRFGRLPLRDLLAPAISYARAGYPVCEGLASSTRDPAEVLASSPAAGEAYLPDGRPPRPGDVVRSPKLAATMETVADKGRDGFYTGPVAEELTGALQAVGGLLTAGDLAAHRSDWTQPISTTYRGVTCYQHPPNSQGFAHLMILNILEGVDLSRMGDGDTDYLHLVVEATKLAFADRDRYLTDPEFAPVPVDHLISKEYAAELRSRIDMRRAGSTSAVDHGGDTTCTVVVDETGNAVCVIQSLYHEYGGGFVAGDTGILLQNRGSFFSLDARRANRLEPGKRTFHTLMPGMCFRNGSPFLVYGAMGGEGQPQTQTALVTRIVDFADDIQRAIDKPRWIYGRTWGHATDDLRVESRFSETTISGLRGRGHTVQVAPEWAHVMGHAQGIVIDQDRSVLIGGADPRGDGMAVGW